MVKRRESSIKIGVGREKRRGNRGTGVVLQILAEKNAAAAVADRNSSDTDERVLNTGLKADVAQDEVRMQT